MDRTDEYQRRFHEKAVREIELASKRQTHSDEAGPVEAAAPVGQRDPGAQDRQRKMDRLHAVSEALRPELVADLKIPLDSALSSRLPEKFVVLDLETTGLSPALDEIIEIGAIRVTISAETQTAFQTLVIPQREIPAEITSLTGITQRMVHRDGRPAAQALEKFAEFIGDLPLVIFNAPFDMGFLWKAGEKHGIAIRNRYACALQLSRRAWPRLSNHKLTYLAKRFEMPNDEAHRSLGDARRALYVFLRAVSETSERVRWDYRPLDWRVAAAYNKERDANRTFCVETRALEATDLELALSRYAVAMERMYEYEMAVDGRFADAGILDRFTLCLWKSGRYDELVDAVEQFAGKFPEVQSSLMTAVLKRRERARSRLAVAKLPETQVQARHMGVPGLAPETSETTDPSQPPRVSTWGTESPRSERVP